MIAVAVSTAPPNTPEWRAERRRGIGASEIAALLGHNRHQSPLDVWTGKVGDGDGFEGNFATRRGLHLEAFLIGEWLREHPDCTVTTPATGLPSIVAHPEHPIVRASLDGYGTGPGGEFVVEVKTAGRHTLAGWRDGNVPDAYLAQVVWQLGVTGAPEAVVIADLAGEFTERRVAADPALFEAMVAYAVDWWARYVAAGVPPDPDPVRDADKLAALWTPDPDRVVRLDPDLIDALHAAQAAAKTADADLAAARARVQIAMRAACTATDSDGTVIATWQPTTRTSLDTAGIKAHHPRITKRYSRITTGRRFVIKERNPQ